MDDDDRTAQEWLLTPSLGGSRREVPLEGDRPWRIGSQLYVAFFGGPLAAGWIGFANGRRLGLTPGRRWTIAALGVGAFALAVVVVGFVLEGGGPAPRLSLSIAGVLTYVAANELQKHADRLYAVGRDEDQVYDSLWAPGLLTVVVAGVASAIVLAAVVT